MSLVFKNKKREGKGVVQDLLYMLLIPLVTWSLYGNNTSLDFCEGGGGRDRFSFARRAQNLSLSYSGSFQKGERVYNWY